MALPPTVAQNVAGPQELFSDSIFLKGCNSGVPAYELAQGEWVWSENTVNRGGVIQTRPGFKALLNLPEGKLQGGTSFRPNDTDQVYLLFAIDGRVYISAPPYTGFSMLTPIRFSKNAPFIYWQTVLKAAQTVRNPDGDNIIQIVSPAKRILVMQDGGFTRAATWDGVTAAHVNPAPPNFGIPTGGPMAFIGDRLWVGSGPNVYASDLAQPDRFEENDYLAEGLPFQIDGDCVALKATNDQRVLLAFTKQSGTAFKAGIRKRETWKDTLEFQKVIYPEVGCLAHKSCINQYGLLWWFSEFGLTNENSAAQTYINTQLYCQDREMARSKGNMSPIVSGMAGAKFENYLLLSTPSGDIHNAKTWVLDQSAYASLSGGTQAAWNGVWTGIRPVEWIPATVTGIPRLFCVSKDEVTYEGTKNRLWEAFVDRTDSGSPIACLFESKLETRGPNLNKIDYIECAFGEIKGPLKVKIYWRGLRGGYKLCCEKDIIATSGAFGTEYMRLISDGIPIESMKKQYRYLKSETILDKPYDAQVEGVENGNIDRAFSTIIIWYGQAALLAYRIVQNAWPEPGIGMVEENESGEERMVTEGGENIVYVTAKPVLA